MTLPKIELGSTGKTLSRLALGGFHQVEISSEIVRRVVDTFLEVGGNYIETARGYGGGASEIKLGRVLEGRRNQVSLCSKSGAETADDIRKDIETSLENLKTDHIEFYYFHGMPDMEKLDRIMKPDGALSGMLKAKEEGLIGGIGLSSHRLPMYLEGMRRLPIDLILIWSNYLEDMYLPEISGEIFKMARDKGIGITAMKPLADGFLYRNVNNSIRYSLGSGSDILVCGMNSPDHVRQVAEAVCQGPSDETGRDEILKTAPELGTYVCRQCGECNARLMELFRMEGYVDRQMIDYLEHDPADYALRLRLANWFSLDEIARQRFREKNWDAAEMESEAGEVVCPYGIDVRRKTKIATSKLEEKDTNRI